jgi:phosphatidylglycerophosphate synthase
MSPAPGGPRRDLRSLTAAVEKRALLWLAARTPAFIGSDHLTLLGLAGMAGAGLFYWLSGPCPVCLHAVNACLALNWLGDSLDGTLARYRNRSRPRYGFYVDHMVDAFGALFVLGGLAASGLVSPGVALGLLIAYLMLAVNMYLATCSLGVFKMSYAGVGGTEARLLLGLLNLALLRWPVVEAGGASYRLLDVVGVLAAAALAIILVVETGRNTAALSRAEPLPRG